MDWLSEIDAKYGVDLPVPTAYSADYGDLTCIRRMARVLREFGRYVILEEKLRAMHEQEEASAILFLARKNLSDDAKELCVAARESSRE